MATFNAQIQSLAQTYLAPKVVDTILKGSPFAMYMLGKSKQTRGTAIEKSVQVVAKSNGGSFSGLDTFNTNNPSTKVKMSYDIRAYEEPVVIPGTERDAVAASQVAAVNLVKESMEEAGNAMAESVGTIFFGDGTGNSNKDFIGLKAIVDDGTIVATIGGLSRATYTTLKANVVSSTGGLTQLSTLATAVSRASVNNDKPNLHLASKTRWDEFEALLQPTLRTDVAGDSYRVMTGRGQIVPENSAGLKGEAGFTGLYYRGAFVTADELCPDGFWYVLNTKYLDWYGLASSDPNFKDVKLAGNTEIEGPYQDMSGKSVGVSFSGLMNPINQYAQIGHFIMQGNLVSFNPKRHSRIDF